MTATRARRSARAAGERETAVVGGALAAAVTASGRVYVEETPDATVALEPRAASRIRKAFDRSSEAGVLLLGLSLPKDPLPASLAFFRDLARAYLTEVCRSPAIATEPAAVVLPADRAQLAERAAAVPPMTGAEHVTEAVLVDLWTALGARLREEIDRFGKGARAFLQKRGPAWNAVGRVCFHLAENKRSEERPFAFLATYAPELSVGAATKHVPLARALEEYKGARNKRALLSLLLPVKRAAERSALVRELTDSQEIYHPLAWTPKEAYRLLRDAPHITESGVLLRLPDWWKRRPARPAVTVTVGGAPARGLGAEALLDFSLKLSLGGKTLRKAELERLLASTDGLAKIRGRWVEVDPARLREALRHWKQVERAARRGLSFREGMRLLAGVAAPDDETLPAEESSYTRVVAGEWLRQVLQDLRAPGGALPGRAGADFRATLRPYQSAGLAWLSLLERLELGGCLADDMGLGKTVQVLALLDRLRGRRPGHPHLLVLPASLIANWVAEAERFAPRLRLLVAHTSVTPRKTLRAMRPDDLASTDVVLTSYGSVHRYAWIRDTRWNLVCLDEAQAIKNAGARQSRAVKALRTRVRLALTGTPIENRLSDLWSLFDFLSPGLLGSQKAFGAFAKRLAESDRPDRYRPLRELVRPYILRRRKSDPGVADDLPDKTEVRAYCTLTKPQAALYQETVRGLAKQLSELDGIQRRGLVLATLTRLKQICNHPSQWLRDGEWTAAASGKACRLEELARTVAERHEKMLVFTQFRETTEPLATWLEGVFGRPGLVLSGKTAVKRRMRLVERFQDELGPPFFVLSLRAGGTGLNLTAASHVVHFDRWWNPAVENQATDRAYRIGQHRNVLVHKLVCRGTLEERIDEMIEQKKTLAEAVVETGGEVSLTELSDAEILRLVSLDLHRACGAS